jgi:phosphopantetheinyl transferase
MMDAPGWWFCLDVDLSRPEGVSAAALCLARFPGGAAWETAYGVLDAQERSTCDGFRHEARRMSYLAGRWVAKQALAVLAGVPDPGRFGIGSGVFSQPLVARAPAGNLQVSISHSGPWAAAVAFPEGHPLGVDLEDWADRDQSPFEEYLSPDERAWADGFPLGAKAARGVLWTAKEALSKAIRTGLMTPLGLYETRGWTQSGLALANDYPNFPQYRGCSLSVGGVSLTVCHPARTTCRFDAQAVADFLKA